MTKLVHKARALCFAGTLWAGLPAPSTAQATPSPEPEQPRTHADAVGWNEPHPVTENVYFQPGKGLTVESRDGLFKLGIRVRGQFLYDLQIPDDRAAEHSFSLRRARLVFAGHAWGPNTAFKLELAVSPRDIGMTDFDPAPDAERRRVTRSPLLDFYVQFKQVRDLNVRMGQYKIPFSRQRVISSGDLMFVDRSIVNAEFNLDRDLGFDFRSKDFLGWGRRLRYYAGIYTGEGHSAFGQREVSSADHFFGLNTLVRIEVLPMGDFDDYKESDLTRNPTPKLSLGATFAHVGQGRGERAVLGRAPDDGGTTDFLLGEADAIFKWRGFSAQTEFMLRRGKRNDDGDPAIPPPPPRNGWGLTGQVGYLTPINLEFAVRHSAVRGDAGGSLDDSNESGLALGYYFAGHPYKVQMDFLRLYDRSIASGAYLFRTQVQVSL